VNLSSRYQFRQLLAGPGSVTTSISTIVVTHLLALARAVISHLHGSLANIAIKRGIVLHKMGSRQAHLSTIQQHIDVLIFAMLTPRLSTRLSRLHTNSVTVQAILNALLYLYLAH
jgi:hypothetical protein